MVDSTSRVGLLHDGTPSGEQEAALDGSVIELYANFGSGHRSE